MDYKKELYRLLEKLPTNQQVDIKETCTLMEKYIQPNRVNENYQDLYKLFQDSECQYIEFKLQLGKRYLLLLYRNSILTRIDKQERLDDAMRFESYKLALLQIEKDFSELNQLQQQDLATDIADELYRLKSMQSYINDSINIQEDIYNLLMVSNKKIDTITFKYDESKREVKSQTVIKLLQEEFYNYIQIRRFQGQDIKELSLKIKNLKTTKKHLVTLAIRQVANILVKHELITDVSKEGNRYRLVNKYGEILQLSNQTTIKIYGIIKALGFNTSFKRKDKSRGNDDKEPTYEADIKDFIKERLRQEAILQINLKSLHDDYQGYIL